jgi:integrase
MAQLRIDRWRQLARFTGADDFMFAIRKNRPIDLHNAMARQIRPTCRRLKLPLVGWHDFRHTYTTWGREAGIKPEVLRDQLGHASVQTALDVYSHASGRAQEVALVEKYVSAQGEEDSQNRRADVDFRRFMEGLLDDAGK